MRAPFALPIQRVVAGAALVPAQLGLAEVLLLPLLLALHAALLQLQLHTRRLLETLTVSIVLPIQLIAAGAALVPAQLDTAAVLLSLLLFSLLLALHVALVTTSWMLEMRVVLSAVSTRLVVAEATLALVTLDMAPPMVEELAAHVLVQYTRRLLETLNVSIVLPIQLIAAGTALVPAQLDMAAVLLLPLLLALHVYLALPIQQLLETLSAPLVLPMQLIVAGTALVPAQLDMAEALLSLLLFSLLLALHVALVTTSGMLEMRVVLSAVRTQLVVAEATLALVTLDMALPIAA